MAPVILLIPPLLVVCKALLTVVGTGAATAALEGVVDAVTKQKHEKQLQECLERAFKQTKKQFKWSINNKTAFSNFKSSLISFAGTFEQDSLKKLLGTSIGKEVSDREVESWIDNLIKQITLDEHNELFKYLMLNNIFVDSSNQKDSVSPPEAKTNYILTSSASIFDNPEIICRDEFIEDLLQLLSSDHKRIQITGMGGLGKTETLAKLFAKLAADKQHSDFDHIAFIRFSGDILTDIETQLDYPRQYLGLQGIVAAKRFLHDLCAVKNVLLCIDDIRANQEIIKQDNPSIQYLRSLGASVVLSARAGFPDFKRNDLSFLSTKACKELFEKKFGKAVSDANDIEVLTNIIEDRAGNHTLIINRLGNMAKDYGWSIPALAEKLEEKDFNFQKGIADEELLQQEINKLYRFNDELSESEKSVLEAFSIFPAVPLPAELCVDWLYEDASIDPDYCRLLLNKLAEKTWIGKQLYNTDAPYSMHQLVRKAIQKQSILQLSTHQMLIEKCAVSLYESTKKFDFAKSNIILQFALSINNQVHSTSISFCKLSAEIAGFYNEIAEYNEALKWYQISLESCKNIDGDDQPDVSAIYNNIGLIYKLLCSYDLALEWYQKALAAADKKDTGYLAFKALVYNNIGIVYDLQREFKLALESFHQALKLDEQVLSENDPEIAKVYTNIASVFEDIGLYNQALDWNFKALSIKEKVLQEDHPSVALSYNNIAGIYEDQHQYDVALKWYHKALAIRENVLGKEHPDTGISYNNIAWVYKRLYCYNRALELFKKAYTILYNKLGPEHPLALMVKKSVSDTERELEHQDK